LGDVFNDFTVEFWRSLPVQIKESVDSWGNRKSLNHDFCDAGSALIDLLKREFLLFQIIPFKLGVNKNPK